MTPRPHGSYLVKGGPFKAIEFTFTAHKIKTIKYLKPSIVCTIVLHSVVSIKLQYKWMWFISTKTLVFTDSANLTINNIQRVRKCLPQKFAQLLLRKLVMVIKTPAFKWKFSVTKIWNNVLRKTNFLCWKCKRLCLNRLVLHFFVLND